MFRKLQHLGKRGVVVLTAIVGITLLSLSNIQGASAATAVRIGPGIMTPGYDLVGIYIFSGHRWVCISPLLRLDSGQNYKQISNLAHVSVTTSREIEYLLYTYIGTTNNHTAASLRIAVNDLVHHKANMEALAKWKKYVPAKVYQRGTSNKPGGMIYEASHYRGPYKLVNQVSSKPLPGGSTTWRAQLVSAAGYGVPHKTVNFSASGASLSSAHVVTGSGGYARTTLTRTSTSTVRAVDSVRGLASNHMLISLPKPGQQQLLSRAPGTHVGNRFSFQNLPAAPKTKYACTTNCTGVANVTVSDCLKTGIATATLNYVDLTNKNKVLASMNYGRSGQNVCKTAHFTALNGHHIKPVLTYHIRGKNYTVNYKVVVIDCPPSFGVTVAQKVFCGCEAISVQSDVNKGTTTATVSYSDSAGHSGSWQVAPGQSLSEKDFTTTASSVNFTVTESLPYATHAGARTLTDSGTVTVTEKG